MNWLKVFFSLLMGCLASSSFAFLEFEDNAYFGLNAQQIHLKWVKNFGSNLLPKSAFQINPFVGIKVYDYVGFEMGFTYAKSGNHYAAVKANQHLFGRLIVAEKERHQGQFLLSGWHTDLQLSTDYFWDDFQLFGFLGIHFMKAKVENMHLSTQLIAMFPEIEINRKTRLKSGLSPILRFGGGLQYAFTNQLSIRANVLHENTAKISIIKDPTQESQVKFKDSLVYSIGLVFHL